jgi:hypothetical protein
VRQVVGFDLLDPGVEAVAAVFVHQVGEVTHRWMCVGAGVTG